MEAYLDLLNIDSRHVGIVFGPRINEDVSGVDLDVNVRFPGADRNELYAIDGLYTYEEVSLDKFLTETYPRVVDEFEERLSDAQLQYYECD